MATHKFTVKSELRDALIFAVISVLQTWLWCTSCADNRKIFIAISTFTFSMWIFLWKGNSILTNFLDGKISWTESPGRRLVVGMFASITYTVLAVFFLLETHQWVFDFSFGFRYESIVYSGVGITIFISLIVHSRAFLLAWREAKVESERHQRESIAARYESLKSQVNPHFLFNSLNALANLVYEDQDKAVKFIKQLSEVYRYVLDSRDKELVSLNEELRFLQSYVYLQQIRFGEKLKVDIQLDAEGKLIAPLALQLLFENAIKHNVISEDDPLTIKVCEENGFIVVENNLQRKMSSGEPSSGIGLENICKRYEFLSKEKVIVTSTDKLFAVKLPIVEQKNL